VNVLESCIRNQVTGQSKVLLEYWRSQKILGKRSRRIRSNIFPRFFKTSPHAFLSQIRKGNGVNQPLL